jgi:hypothetical protein
MDSGSVLRHSKDLLLEAGENVRVVAGRLGHACTAITLDIYSLGSPGMQRSDCIDTSHGALPAEKRSAVMSRGTPSPGYI